MDTRSRNILVNVAGWLYGFLGFSLSVVTALFSVFQRRSPPSKNPVPAKSLPTKPNLPPNARGRRILRSFSDQSVGAPAPAPTPASVAKLRESTTGKRKIISSHRRSRSLIPIIKIDHFDHIESPRQLSAGSLKIEPPIPESTVTNPLPKSYRFTISPDESLPKSGGSTANVVVGDRPAFRLFNPKSWGKDRPNVERRSSSPQLFHPPAALPSLTGSPASHKQSNSDGKLKAGSSSKGEEKPATRKVIRKAKSCYNVREKVNVNVEPPPPIPRNVEKKRSQTLRTQPYEAPYFCTPPIPMPVRKSPPSNLRSPPPLPSHSKPLVSSS
ncbi:hypothetical protein M413DRAFT_439211 [Hebeloma cylindrosporum]|uniref:Uncharacterized protein n=1 Tax=Hebeloma cylindrosporum TaxID=76867 RepID=A0A0C2Z2P7_HEBCY|nr:hypothetical protein M413DRAFT_439211 [Hebeloma cylindrosporum h7]